MLPADLFRLTSGDMKAICRAQPFRSEFFNSTWSVTKHQPCWKENVRNVRIFPKDQNSSSWSVVAVLKRLWSEWQRARKHVIFILQCYDMCCVSDPLTDCIVSFPDQIFHTYLQTKMSPLPKELAPCDHHSLPKYLKSARRVLPVQRFSPGFRKMLVVLFVSWQCSHK